MGRAIYVGVYAGSIGPDQQISMVAKMFEPLLYLTLYAPIYITHIARVH